VKYFDVITYLFTFRFLGIPIYYAIGYSMPMFLSFCVLAYHAAISIPPKVKRITHRVIVKAFLMVIGVWVIALTRHSTLQDGLHEFQTQTKYLQYFRGVQGLPLPGAGDILSSLLDASIVSLAMPMYVYRRELWHFVSSGSSPTPFRTD
jgi:putative effector of murein hydrolase